MILSLMMGGGYGVCSVYGDYSIDLKTDWARLFLP